MRISVMNEYITISFAAVSPNNSSFVISIFFFDINFSPFPVGLMSLQPYIE